MSDIGLSSYIGRRVREFRTARGFTQKELAQATGLGQSRISELEKGDPWATDQIEAVAKALQVDVRDLLPPGATTTVGPLLSDVEQRVIDLLRRGQWPEAIEAILATRPKKSPRP